jgi:hypothetical protein
VSTDRISLRALNRATLARQLLLDRSERSVLDAVEHLVGLQAQVPLNPYTGLWSRLAGFQPDALSRLLVDREVVRIVVMRGTIHLVTADDCLLLRPLVQPVLDAELNRHPDYGPALQSVDLEPVLAFARALTAEQPRTGPQLRAAMKERFPDLNAAALAYACRNHLAFIQVPPRGLWGQTGAVCSTTAEAWLGRAVQRRPSIDAVVLRYLAAFGPATPADATTWSRLTGMREVFDRLRPKLRTFRDERDRELYDVPDAPIPDADTPAPPRFLPEYDNVLLSHADRSRFGSDEDRAHLFAVERPAHGSLLLDGELRATWRIEHDTEAGSSTLSVEHVGSPTKRAIAAIGAEGRRFLRFTAPDATTHDVHLTQLD